MKRWVCENCGKEFYAHQKSYGRPRLFCSKSCEVEHKKGLLVFGIAYNDVAEPVSKNKLAYTRWHGMLERCYSKTYQEQHPTYESCYVCEQWLNFSAFLEWFNDNYVSGYDLDKDILIQGNKVYSPETCCFVPNEINKLLTDRKLHRGECCLGVRVKNGRYYARCNNNTGHPVPLGGFASEDDAFQAYASFKADVISGVAKDYFSKGLIKQNVYKALLNYKILK